MSNIGEYIRIGVYDAKDFQNVFILEYWDDNMNVKDKVYKTKRNLLKAINRISAEWPERGVRFRTVQGVRIVELLRTEVARTPGYQAIRVIETLDRTETVLTYQNRYCGSRVETHKVETIETTEDLQALASSVAAGYGFTDVTAHWFASNIFKIRWTRNFQWIQLEVTDYIKGADTETMRTILTCIFEQFQGAPKRDYPAHVKAYLRTLRSDEDVRRTYISRNHLELKDSGMVKQAMEKAGVTGYTETWYYPTGKDPQPEISAVIGVVALPKGHDVDLDRLAESLAYADRKLFGA